MANKIKNIRISFIIPEQQLFSLYHAITNAADSFPASVSPLLWALTDKVDQDKYAQFCREHYHEF